MLSISALASVGCLECVLDDAFLSLIASNLSRQDHALSSQSRGSYQRHALILAPDGETGASLGDDDGSTYYVVNLPLLSEHVDRCGGVSLRSGSRQSRHARQCAPSPHGACSEYEERQGPSAGHSDANDGGPSSG